MKNITNRKLRIPMTLKVIKNGKTISSVTKSKKSQIRLVIEAISFAERGLKVFIRVNYGIGVNESEHTNKESLINALNIYTEKKLVDSIHYDK